MTATSEIAESQRWRCRELALFVLLLATPAPALAAQVQVVCEGEAVTVPDWNAGTMTLTYSGGDSGTVVIKGPHTDIAIPARSIERTVDILGVVSKVTNIIGTADTTSTMPDLAAVQACVAGKIPASLKDDADVYFTTALSCFGKAQMAASAVPVRGDITITMLPGDEPGTTDVLVQGKRTYLGAPATPGGPLSIDISPKDCKLSGK